MNAKKIEIYTDGSCKGNPGPGGWAALLLEERAEKPFEILKGNDPDTTNNRMEMIGIIEALRYIHENNFQKNSVTLFSDSNLIIQTLLQGWKKKANLDLWEELDALNEELDVKFVWVKGHAKNRWNNECDKVAQSESLKAQKKGPFAKPTPRGKIFPLKPVAKKSHSQQELF